METQTLKNQIIYTDERACRQSADYTKSVQALIEACGINTKHEGGVLLVEEVLARADRNGTFTIQNGTFTIWHDASGWSISDTFNWLGY